MLKRTIVGAAAVLLMMTSPAYGQRPMANCRGMWTATLASGRPHGDLSACGPELLPDIVAAIRGARSTADTTRLATLVWYASGYRHPDVWRESSKLAGDRSATRSARIAALLILASQHQRNLAPTNVPSMGALLTGTTSYTCQWQASTTPYVFQADLPPDYLEQMRTVVRGLQVTGEDPAVRNLSRCIMRLIQAILPEAAPAGAITVTNRCDTFFIIRNSSRVPVTIRWAVDDAADASGELIIQPSSNVELDTFVPGMLRVYSRGTEVGSAASGGACS